MSLNVLRRLAAPLAVVVALGVVALSTVPAAASSFGKGKMRCVDGVGIIAGTVLDVNGAPVAGATVQAKAAKGLRGQAMAEDDGSYRIEGLCAGDYRVRAMQRGAGAGHHDADGDGRPDAIALTDDAPEAEGVDIELPGAKRERLAPTAACTDPQGSIAGTVVDAAGDPVAGARVRAVQRKVRAETTTDADGGYLLEDLCPGDWKVSAQGRSLGTGAGHYDADGDGSPDPVSLSDGAPGVTGIDITLPESKKSAPVRAEKGAKPPKARCDDPAGSIAGMVVDAKGEPVADARVDAHGPGGQARAETDEDGNYLLEGLCPGDYRVKASSRGGGAGQHDADGDGKPDPVTVTADAPAATGVNITLRKKGGG
jgi:protocatechuate 3,4-dioxygenase beta subunit